MRTFLLSFALLFCLSAQAQTFWAKTEAGSNVDETLAVTGDAIGNTYTTGYFSGTAGIDGNNLAVNGLTDIFVSKIAANGATVWTKSFGGSSSDRGLAIAVDSDGNSYVSGFFAGTVSFGGGLSMSSEGNSQDAFVMKLSPAGTALWVKRGGSAANSDRANSIAVDNSGNVFITGVFSGMATFGALSLTSLNNTLDAFIVKYDSNGNELWAKKGSGNAADRGIAITTDAVGNAYSTGQFSGNITFDNTYTNTILNAFYVIKHSASGNEEWFRWAGGSEQSIANGIASDGSSIFLTGNFGASISFLGSGTSTLSSGYTNGVFIASYSTSGNLSWSQSQGSASAVSSNCISARNGQLAIAGWHECTFESLSEVYGESTFNSIGYKDVFMMRYSTAGAFGFARNFGSRLDEIATGIHILLDGFEVITGVFEDQLVIPVGAQNIQGLSPYSGSPNAGATYCGDENYGKFGLIDQPQGYNEDGFTLKAIDPNRSPYDMYRRYGEGCDLSIPESCILISPLGSAAACPESIIECAPYNVHAVNDVPINGQMGFRSTYQWSPNGGNSNYTVSQAGTVSVTLTSVDGCYTSMASVQVDVYPGAQAPLISDSEGVNTMQGFPTQVIELCPDETVDLWGHYPNDYEHSWSGPAIGGQGGNDTLTVSQQGIYTLNVTDGNGCSESLNVAVQYSEAIPDLEPYLVFNTSDDTLRICGTSNGVQVFDSLTMALVDANPFMFDWSITGGASISGSSSSAGMGFPGNGWYAVTVEIESEENPCDDSMVTYSVTDSVYALLYPVPTSTFSITGPAFTCPGDTFALYVEYGEGTVGYNFNPIQNFGDSLYVTGSGTFGGSISITNEFGCEGGASANINVAEAETPVIASDPENPVLCPGDSITLFSLTQGSFVWQTPDGSAPGEPQITVGQAGLYFAEVSFYPGCALASNTIEVTEYATPYLDGNGGVLCSGETVEISIESSSISNINWLEPLSGNSPSQIIDEPGTYTVQVTSCDILSEISIDVMLDTNTVLIIQPDLTPICYGDSILIQAIPNFYPEYNWNVPGAGSEIYTFENGSVELNAVDQFGCPLVSNSLEVNFEPIPPTPNFLFDLVCEGEDQMLTVNWSGTVHFTDGLGGAELQTDSEIALPNFLADTTFYAYLTSDFCTGALDSVTLSPKPYPDGPVLLTDAPVCTGTTLSLQVLNAASQVVYRWLTPAGNLLQGSDINYGVSGIEEEGIYVCVADLNECLSEPTAVDVSLFETVQVMLPPDTNLCIRQGFMVGATPTFKTYMWQDGSTDPTFSPDESVDLFLIVTDFNDCQSFDEMKLDLANCTLEIPNVLTPNGDGRNDSWLISNERPVSFLVTIYNRWGTIVFESRSIFDLWDGMNYKSGEPCSEGTYYYVVQLNNFEGAAQNQAGYLSLFRE